MLAFEAYYIAYNSGKERVIGIEPIILQDVYWIYRYSLNIVKGRWEEAEPILLGNEKWSYHYAKDVLRFDIKHKDFYIKAIKHLWAKLPEAIQNDPDIMAAYFKETI